MRELDIRKALRDFLVASHAIDQDTLVVDELGLCQGDARVDLAVINGALNGYEIKSDRDTLDRLPRQRDFYSQCFERMTIVVGRKHIQAARRAVPAWWGIVEAADCNGQVVLTSIRTAKPNRAIHPEALVKFLWKNELIAALREVGVTGELRHDTRLELRARLTAAAPAGELPRLVRLQIKARGEWRSRPSPFRGGGSRRSSAKSQRSQANLRWLLSCGSQHPQR